MKRLSILLLTLLTACTTYSTSTTALDVTNTDWDQRLHTGIDDVFGTCTQSVPLLPGQTEIDLVGSCAPLGAATAQGDVLLGGLILEGPLPMTALPSVLAEESASYSNLPWPNQNCTIDFDVTLEFVGAEITGIDSAWTSTEDFTVTASFPADMYVADLVVTGDVTCPSAVSEALVQAVVDLSLPGPIEISLEGLEVVSRTHFTTNGFWIFDDTSVAVELDAIDVNLTLINLANLIGIPEEELLADFGVTMDLIEEEIGSAIGPAFSPIGSSIGAALNESVPSGHVICSLDGTATRFRIVSDDPGPTSCVQRILNPNFPPTTTPPRFPRGI